MNVFSKAISEVKYRIPAPILESVFNRRTSWRRENPPSVDEQIMSLIVRPRVFVDCNLVGGTETFIPLGQVPVERQDGHTFVYRVPKTMTQNRSIISVLNVTFQDPNKLSNYGQPAGCQNTPLMQAGQAVMDAMAAVPITSSASVQLIGENVVMVRDSAILAPNAFLRCVLANDENMSHIQLRSYHVFSKLIELAVKAYIYNDYIIPMDMGELHGGQALGRFKEIIDGYADAQELYDLHLREVVTKVSLMNDRESHTRFLKLIIGGNR